MEAYPLPNQYSHIVAEKLVNEFVSRFGIPLEIHTDQGTNFQSNLFQELCRLLDIHKTKSTPFHPSSNGLIEKFNQTLGKMIKSYVDENKRKWDFYIPILMSAYRSTVHPSTGFSPNKLMLGREVNLPHELLYPLPRHNAQKPVNEYVDDLRVHMEDIYHVARENLKQSGEKQKRDHDTRIIDKPFLVGSLVFRKKPFFKKLESPWSGPFVVIKQLSPVVYKIRDSRKCFNIHFDNLRAYESSVFPSWVKKVKKQFLSM